MSAGARRRTMREFPAAAAAAAPAPRAPVAPTRSAAEEIAHLGELRSAGSITDEEFDRAKQIALA
jgi:Short C-terminal domain